MGVQVHLVALGLERTGQSQSEVSDIVQGRQMRDVTVLERITEGWACPNGVKLSGCWYQPVPDRCERGQPR
jgi:hypothetical protein